MGLSSGSGVAENWDDKFLPINSSAWYENRPWTEIECYNNTYHSSAISSFSATSIYLVKIWVRIKKSGDDAIINKHQW